METLAGVTVKGFNLVFAALFAIIAPSTADAAVIRVPADVSTIQGSTLRRTAT
jgi:hypothetical protein